MTALDPRLYAFRADLADLTLKDRVKAPAFVQAKPALVSASTAYLHKRPAADAPLDSELFFGESLRLFEQKDGWAWVQNETDGYVGYLRADALTPLAAPMAPSHQVQVLRTFLYPAPSIKTPAALTLPMNAFLRVEAEEDKFLRLTNGLFVLAAHCAPLGAYEPDRLKTARLFLNSPYLWGGRSSLGLDCSAFVQHVYLRAGICLPRDADQQEGSQLVGKKLALESPLAPGDVIFWKGHVAIALDPERVIHATGHSMLCVEEPLAAVDARARGESGQGITAIRRL